jgi:hypothetical protein
VADFPYNHRPGGFESRDFNLPGMVTAPSGRTHATADQMPQKKASSQMDDTTLLQVLEEYEQESYGYMSGDLAAARAYAIERYLGLPYGDEVDGRSAVVDTGLRDTVEWIMPQLLRVFVAGDKVVEFNPANETDEGAAEQETDYVNHVILERNDAFNIFSTWFRDALITKVGYVKSYWQERTDVQSETYKGLTDDQLMMLESDKEVEIISQQGYPDPLFAQPMPAAQAIQMAPAQAAGAAPVPMRHDVKLRRVKAVGYAKIENVPAEEIRIHRATRTLSLSDCQFVRHSRRMTLSELRQAGYKVPDHLATGADDNGSAVNDQITITRDRFADDQDFRTDNDSSIDPSARRVWLHEDYVRVDYDGDGIAELRKVCHLGRVVLANEECDIIPIAAVTPIIFPHRHVGIGYDDLCDMPSKVSTALQRQMLDNLYLQSNGRYAVDVTRVNIDDMLVSRPGGLVRVEGNPGDALFPFTHPPVAEAALNGLQWAQQWRTMCTGVSPDNSNLSADSLNNTAPGTVSQVVAQGQTRVEAVARSFATGVKDLFAIVHAITLKNATVDEKIKLNNKWVTIDPREWVKRTSLTITVGLGTGTRESRIQQLTMLAQMQAQGVQAGIVTPPNLYHTGTMITQEMGYKNAEDFWTDPAKQPPKPPQPPPEVMVEQMRQQSKQQELQMTMQAKGQELAQNAQFKQQELASQQQVQASNDQRDYERSIAELQMKERLEMQRMQMDFQIQLEIAKIKASAQVQSADITASKQQADSMYQQEMNG